MALRELVDGIFATDDGSNGGNLGAMILDNEIIMIDSGMIHPKSAITKNTLESKTGLPIRKLIFTHSHSDHVFGAQAFEPIEQICSGPMYRRCKANLESEWKHENIIQRYDAVKDDRPELWQAVQNLKIRLPDIVFEDSLQLGPNNEVTMKLYGGHTSGSSVVISHAHNTVFIGDLIFNKRFPYAGDPTCDPDRWILALEEIHSREFDVIIPGHGPVCGQDELEGYVIALSELRDNVKHALKTGLSVESFVEREMVPEAISAGFERFGVTSLEHWFSFYG